MDRRTKYTTNIIKNTLIDLLQEKDINKITVSEICEIADINRATFYRYYLDVYDLLEKIEQDFEEEIKEALNNTREYSVSSFSKDVLYVLLSNKKLVNVLFNSKSTINFFESVLLVTYEKCFNRWKEDIPTLSTEEINYANIFIFNGALGIIKYWVESDFKEDLNNIASIIEELSYYGTRRYIYKK